MLLAIGDDVQMMFKWSNHCESQRRMRWVCTLLGHHWITRREVNTPVVTSGAPAPVVCLTCGKEEEY